MKSVITSSKQICEVCNITDVPQTLLAFAGRVAWYCDNCQRRVLESRGACLPASVPIVDTPCRVCGGSIFDLNDAGAPVRCTACAHGVGASSEDPVNHPSHYTQHAMECINVIRTVLTPEEFRGFCLGNNIKYRWRRDDKGKPAQDMAKAAWYLAQLGKTDE